MNEMLTSDLSDELQQFCDNLKANNKDSMLNHNMYELTTVDMDGNIIDKKFGVNLITNVGLNYYFNSDSYYFRMMVGTGTGIVAVTDTSLFSKLAWTNTEADKQKYITPIVYDSINGVIIMRTQILTVYYDYNISGVTTPTIITEFGMYGSSESNLTTHSLIYDSDGNLSSITKNINERLYITTFFVINVKESLINDAWNNGWYTILGHNLFIDKPVLLFDENRNNETYDSYWQYRSIDEGMYSVLSANIDSSTSSLVVNESGTCSFVVQNKERTICGASLGMNKAHDTTGLRITKPLKLSTPETIELPYLQTTHIYTKSFEHLFGHYYKESYPDSLGYYPITDFNMSSLTTYNSTTHNWDIPVNFVSPSNCDYCNYFDSPTWIYVKLNGVNKNVRVYFNIHQDLPITAFNVSPVIIYATDKYWDTSTYVLIENRANIIPELRSKKYYVTESVNTELSPMSLNPVTNRHEVITNGETHVIANFTHDNYNWNSCASTEYHWIITSNKLVFINDTGNFIHTMLYQANWDESIPLFNTGDLIAYWYNSKFNIVDASIQSATPTTTQIVLDYGVGVSVGSPMFTFSDFGGGYIVAQNLVTDVNSTVILSLHGAGGLVIQNLINNTKHCNAILLTNKCVYQRSDIISALTFEIYDMENMIVADTFTISAESGTIVKGIRCWSNFVYVLLQYNSSYSTYLYRLDTHETVLLSWNVNYSMDTNYLKSPTTYAVDECMIFTIVDSIRYNDIYMYIVSKTDPTELLRMPSGSTKYVSSIFDFRKVNYNNGTKILLTVYTDRNTSVAKHVLYDVGFFIDNPTTDIHALSTNDYTNSNYIYYDNGYIDLYSSSTIYWYPMEYLLTYKATGTTRTIQCMNNPKQITQSFNLKLTNDLGRWT